MKRSVILMLCLGLLLLLCACGGKAEAPEAETAQSGETPVLYVANWQAYNSDEDYCEKAFEAAYGCEVEHVYFNSYDELMTTLMTGGNATIDACVLSQNYTQLFHEKGLIMNVDAADVPNYADVDPVYKDLFPYAVDEAGNLFAFPWTSGVTSIGYNPAYVTEEITSWSDLLNPDYAGHVCLFSDYGDGMIIAALLSGQDPSDVENLDLDLVAETLAQLKPQILSFWDSNDSQLMPYRAGEFWIGNMWSGPYAELMTDENIEVKYVHPAEGTVGYLDYWTIVEGTDQYELACQWINWIESYEQQYTMATGEGTDFPGDYPTYAPINGEALAGLTQEQKVILGLDPMPTKICMLNYLTDEQRDAWTEVWNDFMASVG